MDVAEMVAQGWKFQIVNDRLLITSEQDPNQHLEMSAQAAFSLLDYLYRYRNALADTIQGNERENRDTAQ